MAKYRPVMPELHADVVRKLRLALDASTPGPWRFDGEHFTVGDQYMIFEAGDPEVALIELVSEHLGTLLDMLDTRYVIFQPITGSTS